MRLKVGPENRKSYEERSARHSVIDLNKPHTLWLPLIPFLRGKRLKLAISLFTFVKSDIFTNAVKCSNTCKKKKKKAELQTRNSLEEAGAQRGSPVDVSTSEKQ